MKIKSNKTPITYTLEVSENELSLLQAVLGNTKDSDDVKAGVPVGTSYAMYHAIDEELNA